MNFLRLFGIVSLVFTVGISAYAQQVGEEITLKVNDYSLIETNYAPVALSFATPIPGAPIATVSNSDLFVKISSVVPGGTHRKMSVQMTSGTIPDGTILKCLPAECTTTNSGGELGLPVTTPVVLSAIDKVLVSQIGTCYTGTSYNDGYQITFTWQPDDPSNYHQITATSNVITVVFTLSAHDGNN